MTKIDQFLEDISKDIISKVDTAKSISFRNGKCSAHQYHLEPQGPSERSRYIYRCKRDACRHYATFADIEGRRAECHACGNHFTVRSFHFVKNLKGSGITELFFEYLNCCAAEAPKEVEIKAVENLDFLEE